MNLFNLKNCIIIICICKYIIGFSQTHLVIEGGYGFPWAVNDFPDGNITFFDDGSKEVGVYKISLGSGMNYSLSINHERNNSLGFSCQLSFLKGRINEKVINISGHSNASEQHRGNMLWIAPQVRIKASKVKKFTPYLEIGPTFGLLCQIIVRERASNSSGFSETKKLYNGGVSYGASSAIGSTYQILKDSKWKLNFEVGMTSASYGPKRSEVILWEQNGENTLETLSIREKYIIYKKKYIENRNNPPDPNNPRIDTKKYYPFSSIRLSLGISYQIR